MNYKHMNGVHTLTIGEQLRDYECSIKLGEIKDALRSKDRPKELHVDMSATTWVDPLPLLSLGNILHTVSDYGMKVIVNLGASTTKEHRVFLKFLATQGFIEAYGRFAEFVFGKDTYPPQRGNLTTELSTFQYPTNFRNADCIFAKFIGVNDYRDDPEHVNLHQKVEELVAEARNRLIESAYGRDPLVRDRLLQKTRKILFELLSNVIEHAFPEEYRGKPVSGYAGIYARMRAGLPNDQEDAEAWRKLWNAEKGSRNCPCLNPFEANPLAPWIELFICDSGVGLLANLNKWTAPNDLPNVNNVLNDLKEERRDNPLQTISKVLFTQPFSSVVDRSGARTSVTGLLHLGLMLQRDGDFARIYTWGEWAGSRHPWNPSGTGGYMNVAKQEGKDPSKVAPGTWFAFLIQPVPLEVEYPDHWVVASSKERELLIETLACPPMVAVPKGVRFEDRRGDPLCSPPKEWVNYENLQNEKVFDETPVVVLRPPRSIQKRQVGIWLDRLAGAAATRESSDKVARFVIADMTPFQAITYAELLSRHALPAQCILEIYFVTENWAVSCLSKLPTSERSQPIFDRQKAKDLMQAGACTPCADIPVVSVAMLLRVLRYADSRLFWRISNDPSDARQALPSDMFLQDRVGWSSSRLTKKAAKTEKTIYIRGYLDLSRALVDVDRYQACHRALRRCMNLFPEFDAVASDDLVHSLTLDANRERHRPHNRTLQTSLRSPYKLVVGSIRVTSSTLNRFLNRADVPKGSRNIIIFNHPDAPTASVAPLAVLDWYPPQPPERDLIDGPMGYERIPETPYIGMGGEKAIIIPRFRPPTSGTNLLADSFYKRDPQQTYDDFNQLGALKLGHWIYGSKHDLLTVNLGRAIELSLLDNGPLYQWLVQTTEELCFTPTTEEGGSPTPRAVLVYPSHPITDQMIAMLSDQSRRHMPGKKGGYHGNQLLEDYVIPLKFLSGSTISPLRASPLSYDRLNKAIAMVRNNSSLCRVVIMDDGTLSGKMFRELEELALSLGATDVHTIALVDRGGLPIQLDYMESFVKNHHRFWRWDVPPLGHRRACPLCTSLAQTSAMRERLPSGAMSRRLAQWADIWRPVEVTMDHWETHGLQSTPLGKDTDCDSHRFSIYPNEPTAASHTIHHRTSTGMTAAIMEITRSTTRSYYAIEKALKMIACYGPQIGIEIISAQLLLFIDELDYWGKLDRLRELLCLLWQCDDDSDTTALAGLCLMLTDDDLVPDLWSWFKTEIMRRKKVPILDGRIAANFLRHRYNGLTDIKPDHLSSDPTEEERYNYLVMFPDSSFRQNIAHVFDIIGAAPRDIHNMGLEACLKDISAAVKNGDRANTVRRLKEARRIIGDLGDALKKLDLRFCSHNPDSPLDPKKDEEILSCLLNRAPDLEHHNSNDSKNPASEWADKIYQEILSPENSNSLAQRYRSQLVKIPKEKTAQNAFLSDVVARVRDTEWPDIVTKRLHNKKPVVERWAQVGIQETSDARPVIEGSNQDTWLPYIAIYFDRYVEHCVYEIVANCVHSHEDIANPWKRPSNDGATEVMATMWWRLLVDECFVKVIFVNACDTTEVILAPTEARSGLERVGGEVVSFVVENPSAGSIRQVSECCRVPVVPLDNLHGLCRGQRAAITIVQIPLMKTVQER